MCNKVQAIFQYKILKEKTCQEVETPIKEQVGPEYTGHRKWKFTPLPTASSTSAATMPMMGTQHSWQEFIMGGKFK